MKWYKFLLVAMIIAATSLPAPATGIFGSRKHAGNPAQQVQQLILTLQTSTDSVRRTDAAEDLREFDTVEFPQIIPVLVNALKTDKSIQVRIEAARSLGKIRPLTKMAGDALSDAASNDPALRVRWQARTSLAFYTVAGVNPHNHAPNGSTPTPPKATISLKEPQSNSSGESVFVPQPETKNFSGSVPVTVTPSSSYALPLPKGPTQVLIVQPVPVQKTPVLAPIPTKGAPPTTNPIFSQLPKGPTQGGTPAFPTQATSTTAEPPLFNATGPQTVPNPALPVIPELSSPGANAGPILAPPS